MKKRELRVLCKVKTIRVTTNLPKYRKNHTQKRKNVKNE